MNTIPSRPLVLLRTQNHLLSSRNGEQVPLVAISKDCGGLFSHHCTVELDGAPFTIDGDFLEFSDKSLVPKSHSNPVASHAWLMCHYAREAHPIAD